MKTRTLTLKELDYDCLPIEGTNIVFFDSSSSFGMFEQHFTQQGEVVYLYGDIADTLEEALNAGGYISIARDDLEGINELAIPVCIGGENATLLQGCLWMYEHDYLPVLDEHYFPFQDQQYYEIALKEGWCESVEKRIEEHELKEKMGSTFITWIYETVMFNGGTFNVQWVSYSGGEEYHLHGYTFQEKD